VTAQHDHAIQFSDRVIAQTGEVRETRDYGPAWLKAGGGG